MTNQEANIGDIFFFANKTYLIVDVQDKRNEVQIFTLLNLFSSLYETHVSPFRGLDHRWKYIA